MDQALGKNHNSLAKLSLGALGIVYGDLGTSPLYTVKECFNPKHNLSNEFLNVAGILSLIFWSLIFVVILKYLIFILRADNDGEGGILSLLALIIAKNTNKKNLNVFITIGIIGMLLLLADSMITPSITVLGAVEGLEEKASFLKPFVIPISLIIIFILFIFQKHGTGKIGAVFGPVMLIWFFTIGLFGLLFIIKTPEILKAINPAYAINFFKENEMKAFFLLGSVVLAITGTEALYADIGHFGKKPIKLAWFYIVMPCLLLNYFGQGSAILEYGSHAAKNPFYFLIPNRFLIPMLVIATCAAVIASQALISGAFSIVHQAIQLGFIPKFNLIHTSKFIRGQIYIPIVNYFLMTACLLLILSFKSSGNLASAYGFSVIGTMICTSLLFFILINSVWKWNKFFTVSLFAFFISIDLSFFTANISKIYLGGWFPLVSACVFFMLISIWRWGMEKIKNFIGKGNIPIQMLIADLKNNPDKVIRIKGTGIFMLGKLSVRINVILHQIKHNKTLHENVIILSIIFQNVPYINKNERLVITNYESGFTEINAMYGYMEQPNIYEIIELYNLKGFNLDPYQISYYLGRITINIPDDKSAWMKRIFRFMHRNSETAAEYFKLPPGRVIEIGSQITI